MNVLTKQSRGFSLIELIVAVSIFAFISTVVLANNNKFNSSVLLGSLAYDIALSVREAQVFGLSVRQFSDNFQVGYGVRFLPNSTYLFFVDTNTNQTYDVGTDAVIDTFSLSRGHTIQSFCGVTVGGTERCSNSSTPISHLDVVFLRPNPDALISSNEPGIYSRGIITVASQGGETRTINIASTGQISVQNL